MADENSTYTARPVYDRSSKSRLNGSMRSHNLDIAIYARARTARKSRSIHLANQPRNDYWISRTLCPVSILYIRCSNCAPMGAANVDPAAGFVATHLRSGLPKADSSRTASSVTKTILPATTKGRLVCVRTTKETPYIKFETRYESQRIVFPDRWHYSSHAFSAHMSNGDHMIGYLRAVVPNCRSQQKTLRR